jgi:hypothetical protein
MKTHFPFDTDETTPRRSSIARSIGCTLVAAGLVLLAAPASTRSAAAAEPPPAPTATVSGAVPRLPVLSAQGASTKIDGSITRSSRGRKGPVRLLVEREGGEPVTVLVAADDYCDRVGLSLRSGEKIHVEGAMVKGERPILIASSITAGGKTVRIRDASGKLVAADGSAATPAGAATLGGGKRSPEGTAGPSGPSQP